MLDDPSQKNIDGKELVALILKDKQYFSIIVDRYSQKLLRYIGRITSVSHEDKEDLLQNIFIKIYININSFDPDFSFNAWVYRIAHNEIIDAARKQKRINEKGYTDIDDDFLQFCKQSMDILDIHYQKEDQEKFYQAFNTVSPKHKEVLYLKYFEMYSYRDISDILKKTESNITSMIHRAKKEFKINYEQLL